MNWFKFLKFAQIWRTQYDEDLNFEDQLKALYELEYKYSMIKNHEFKGTLKRKENILNQLKAKLMRVGDFIRQPILKTFQGWLASHAITDPSQWAKNRVSESFRAYGDDEIESILGDMLFEFYELNLNIPIRNDRENIIWRHLYADISKNIDSCPALKSFLDQEFNDYKINYLLTESLEEINDQFDTSFSTEEQAYEFIDNLTAEEYGYESIADMIGMYDFSTFTDRINSSNLKEEILYEISEKFIFPLWYRKWSAQGIDQTRSTIENIYQELLNADPRDIENFTKIINLALNASHQTGSMLEHLQDYLNMTEAEEDYNLNQEYISLDTLLDRLSNRKDFSDWNKELQEIGVKI